jgi:WD40 repeat protein
VFGHCYDWMLRLRAQDVAQEPIVNCVVHPTSATIVTASRSSLLRVWDVETGTVLKEFKGPRGIVNSMAFDPTGTLLAVGAADRSVMVRCA